MGREPEKSKEKISASRRKFVAGLGQGALVSAAWAGSVGCSSSHSIDWASTYDWISVGSGVAGCAAAIAAHDQGMKTLLIEKSETIGGITSQAAGTLWVPMNHFLKAAGQSDSREEALAYLTYISGGYGVPEMREALVDHAPRVIEYLQQKADVKFMPSELSEFYPNAAGTKGRGRLLACEPFPAETLGDWRSKVRLSIFYRGLTQALGRQEHNPAIAGGTTPLYGPLRNPSDWRVRLWKKRLGDQLGPILEEDEKRRMAGGAVAAYMFRGVLQRGIEVRTETIAEKLLIENGRVMGVAVRSKGAEQNIRATKGILLGIGGPMADSPSDSSTEAGNWRLATAAGAAVYTVASIQGTAALHVPGENFPDGSPATRINYENRMRHSLIVNRFGERFANETPYQGLGEKTNQFERLGEHRFRNIPFYFIFDHNLIEKYSFVGMPPGEDEGLNWVAQGKTVAEVAQKLRLPAAALQATVARFNQHVRRGKDQDFDRDPKTLGAIEKPPFYGVQMMTPDPLRGDTEIIINPNAQVLHHATGKPIPGLYAVPTRIMTSRIWGIGYQGGLSLTTGATFGFLAAENAAKLGC
ncbi:MAG: FAD-binding protein [Acidobacteria bacterium]|nr:FAD-binding protein [Acidobacteriota bacterium]